MCGVRLGVTEGGTVKLADKVKKLCEDVDQKKLSKLKSNLELADANLKDADKDLKAYLDAGGKTSDYYGGDGVYRKLYDHQQDCVRLVDNANRNLYAFENMEIALAQVQALNPDSNLDLDKLAKLKLEMDRTQKKYDAAQEAHLKFHTDNNIKMGTFGDNNAFSKEVVTHRFAVSNAKDASYKAMNSFDNYMNKSKIEAEREAKKADKEKRSLKNRAIVRKEAEVRKYSQASESVVGKALDPLRIKAIAEAKANAEEVVEEVSKKVAKHKGDINIIAPVPEVDYSRRQNDEEKAMNARRSSIMRFAVVIEKDPMTGNPLKVKMSKELCAQYIALRMDAAEQEFISFMYKLVAKVGGVKSAELKEQRGVWGLSHLTVVTDAGVTEVWKTQQIVNRSVHGTYFNQWPTRKIKSSGKDVESGDDGYDPID